MKKNIIGGLVTLAFVAVLLTPQAHAETVPAINTGAIEQIKMLMAKLQELQKQMATIRGEISDVLKSNITEGTSSDDIKKVQELLATDAKIYPEGQVTGYFGPRTKEAIKKFQERHGLPVTGVVDEETKSLLTEYLKERQDNRIPPGLLGAPGIAKKMEDRFKLRCDNRGPGRGVGPLCERLKMHDDDHASSTDDHEDDDHEHEDDEDHHDDDHASSTDDHDEDDVEPTFKNAEKAIRDANKAIADALREIKKTDGDTEDAKALVADAREKATEARTARMARDYTQAITLADEAEGLADEAKELATDADEDDSDEEDGDDHEDDHEDEDEDDHDDED